MRVLSESFSIIPTWQCLDGFQKSLCPFVLDESNLSIGRVKVQLLVLLYSPSSLFPSSPQSTSFQWDSWRCLPHVSYLTPRSRCTSRAPDSVSPPGHRPRSSGPGNSPICGATGTLMTSLCLKEEQPVEKVGIMMSKDAWSYNFNIEYGILFFVAVSALKLS